MRLVGLIAAALILGALLALAAVASARGGGESLEHTCSATDRQFIRTATLNLAAVGSSAHEYLSGGADGSGVIADARRASRVVERTQPTDPSLRRTRLLVGAMFAAYGRAIEAREEQGDAGPHMLKAYGLANFASDIIRSAEPELSKRGCDVSGLL